MRVAFVGDSIVRGERGTSGPAARWTTLVATRFGWSELNLGVDGAGFVARRTRQDAPPAQVPDPFDEAVGSDADVCVVALGINDSPIVLERSDEVEVAIDRDLDRLVRGFGSERVVVMDLYTPFGTKRPPGWVRVRQLLTSVAARQGLGLLSGLEAAICGDDELLAPDGLHPNDAGHQLLASRVGPALERALRNNRSERPAPARDSAPG